jgi:hypothetical protein
MYVCLKSRMSNTHPIISSCVPDEPFHLFSNVIPDMTGFICEKSETLVDEYGTNHI